MSNGQFKIGGEVLCIRTHSGHTENFPPFYVKGKRYVVNGIAKGCIHTPLVISLEGVDSILGIVSCSKCGYAVMGSYWNASNFIPIDNTLSKTTVEDILNETIKA